MRFVIALLVITPRSFHASRTSVVSCISGPQFTSRQSLLHLMRSDLSFHCGRCPVKFHLVQPWRFCLAAAPPDGRRICCFVPPVGMRSSQISGGQ
jgi:hypothetical protein